MYGIYSNSTVIAQFAAPMTVRSNHPVYASDALNLSRQITRRTAQRWEIESALEPLSSGAQDLFAHIVSYGYSTPITIITPQNYGAILKRTSTSSPTASASANSVSVTVSGNVNLIPAGTFIKFSNHNKVYMVTGDRSGNGAMGIYPALRTSVSGTAFTHRDDVQMTCHYDLDTTIGMTFTDGILMDLGTIKLVEAV